MPSFQDPRRDNQGQQNPANVPTPAQIQALQTFTTSKQNLEVIVDAFKERMNMKIGLSVDLNSSGDSLFKKAFRYVGFIPEATAVRKSSDYLELIEQTFKAIADSKVSYDKARENFIAVFKSPENSAVKVAAFVENTLQRCDKKVDAIFSFLARAGEIFGQLEVTPSQKSEAAAHGLFKRAVEDYRRAGA